MVPKKRVLYLDYQRLHNTNIFLLFEVNLVSERSPNFIKIQPLFYKQLYTSEKEKLLIFVWS